MKLWFCRFALLLFLLASPQVARADEVLTRIAFGSCNHQDRPQTIWEPILKTSPELFLFLGDNIYADTQDIAEMRKMYAQLGDTLGYKKLLKSARVLATWDDHDYGKDDAGAEYPRRKESQQAFLDFFGVPKDSPRRTREGVYHAETIGPRDRRVQVILLDTRYHRSPLKMDPKLPRDKGRYVPENDPNATMLGMQQWKWLEERLREPAEVRLICSSIQVVAEDHGHEKWANLPRERDKLFQLIRDTKANGVVFLSGDRHMAELTRFDDAPYPLYDLTSSGMNMGNQRLRPIPTEKHRLALLDTGHNYGLVKIDWGRNDPLLTLEIHDEDGDVMIRQKVPLSRLQANKVDADVTLGGKARQMLGKQWSVSFRVAATGTNKSKEMVYLNSEKDYQSPANFTVVLPVQKLADDLAKAKIADPRKHYAGKKIQVTGEVSLYQNRPQIMVRKLEQVKIEE